MKIIVTGSSGFIGETLALELLELGHDVIGIDLKDPSRVLMIRGKYTHMKMDLSINDDCSTLDSLTDIDCVCHLAAKIRVDESMSHPDIYYHNNIIGLINLLDVCRVIRVKNFIFASTAGVYPGLPKINPRVQSDLVSERSIKGYTESDAGDPKSVYGRTKLMGESILQDYASAFGIKGYIFRFFNVCGGYEPEVIHLLPIIINKLVSGQDVSIFGTDYATKDGTCVRDYIHVKDISRGFISALEKGFDHNGFKIYNLGSGSGYTVKEMVNKTIEIYNKINSIKYTGNLLVKERRLGDPDVLIANCDRVKLELGYTIEYGLDKMITDTILSFSVITEKDE